jgi:hypothetical protein
MELAAMAHSGNLLNDEAVRAAAQAASPKFAHQYGALKFVNLPDPTKEPAGARALVTDSGLTFATANFGATVTGAGANSVPVVNIGGVNGWKIG